jgi:hypothetical protein
LRGRCAEWSGRTLFRSCNRGVARPGVLATRCRPRSRMAEAARVEPRVRARGDSDPGGAQSMCSRMGKAPCRRARCRYCQACSVPPVCRGGRTCRVFDPRD